MPIPNPVGWLDDPGMTIALPDYPAPNGATPGLVDFGGFNVPALGAEVQRIDRMGNRFRIGVTMPPLPSADLGRVWVGRLLRGKSEGVRMRFPLLSFNPGVPGNILINGAGQSGRSLNVRNGTPGYQVREGQFFSVVRSGGRRYLHMVDADATLNGSGAAVLSISPMLRFPFDDGWTCEFAQPMIEGRVLGDGWSWEMHIAHHIGLSFDIEEWG